MQIIVCGVTFCGGFSLVASAVLAGQSFYGRGTCGQAGENRTVVCYQRWYFTVVLAE